MLCSLSSKEKSRVAKSYEGQNIKVVINNLFEIMNVEILYILSSDDVYKNLYKYENSEFVQWNRVTWFH